MTTALRTKVKPGTADYYGQLWDIANAWWIQNSTTLPASREPLCLHQTRDEYIAHMLDLGEIENAYRAKAQAKKDELAAGIQHTKDVERERKEADKAAKAREDEATAWVRDYSGTWGLPLDIRADRRWGTKYMKLSERQVEVLLAGKARDAARAEAAQIDREIYADEQYRSAVKPATEVRMAFEQPITEDGMYQTPDGTIWKVQRAVHGSGLLYAKRLDVEPGRTGTFTYEPGAIRRLRPEHRMTLEDAKAFGKLYGVCCQCGRTLTDEQSIADGIGPVCAGRL